MAKKTASPTPCCNARVSLGDGLRLIACPKCGKAWQTYTGQGHVNFHEPQFPPIIVREVTGTR